MFISQVLSLTHEQATASEKEPYLQALFNPVPVLALYGRSATMDPPCHPKDAVYYGWRDSLRNVFGRSANNSSLSQFNLGLVVCWTSLTWS